MGHVHLFTFRTCVIVYRPCENHLMCEMRHGLYERYGNDNNMVTYFVYIVHTLVSLIKSKLFTQARSEEIDKTILSPVS